MLLNDAHRLNVMCSSYNDIHDIHMYIYIYIILYEIYPIILSVLALAVFIIQLHVTFIETSRFLCEIHDVECIVYVYFYYDS